jgi:hypothetical protein
MIYVQLRARCVYEDDDEEVLVLGKPFVSKTRHYWEDNEVKERWVSISVFGYLVQEFVLYE